MTGYIQTVIGGEGTVETGDGDTPREAIKNTLETIPEMTPEEATASENMVTDKGLCEVILGPDGREDVEIRLWGAKEELGGDGPNVKVRFEVRVFEACPHHEEFGVYSEENIRNGGEFYETLAEELTDIVRDTLGRDAARDLSLVRDEGSGIFAGTAAFR